MSKLPLVSVIIPCFNAQKYIRQAVESCLNQEYKNLEIIAVDDGSTDSSLSILQGLKNRKLKVLQQKNQGASAARNHAYKYVMGEYIQYLDADDMLSPEKISCQVNLLEQDPKSTISLSNTIYFYDGEKAENGKKSKGWPHVDSDNPTEWLIDLLGPEAGGMVQTGAWLTPRAITDKVGPWDLSICPTPIDDGEYFSRVVLASKCIKKSCTGVNYYRQYKHQKSLSSQVSPAFFWGHFRSLKKMETNLYAYTTSKRAKKAFARLYKDLAFQSYPICPEVTKAAIQKAKDLGFGTYTKVFPTKIGRLLSALLGWKTTKRLNFIYHNIKGCFDSKK